MPTRRKSRKLHTRSTITVAFRVPDGERVIQAAAHVGESVSGFIRAAALARAAQVLELGTRDLRHPPTEAS